MVAAESRIAALTGVPATCSTVKTIEIVRDFVEDDTPLRG